MTSFDSHAHFPAASADEHRAQVVRAREAGLCGILAVGGGPELDPGAIAMAGRPAASTAIVTRSPRRRGPPRICFLFNIAAFPSCRGHRVDGSVRPRERGCNPAHVDVAWWRTTWCVVTLQVLWFPPCP